MTAGFVTDANDIDAARWSASITEPLRDEQRSDSSLDPNAVLWTYEHVVSLMHDMLSGGGDGDRIRRADQDHAVRNLLGISAKSR